MKEITFKAFDEKKRVYIQKNIFLNEIELKNELNRKKHKIIRIIAKRRLKDIKKERIILIFETIGRMINSGIALKKAFEYMKESSCKEEKEYLKKIIEKLELGENILDILEHLKMIKKKINFSYIH